MTNTEVGVIINLFNDEFVAVKTALAFYLFSMSDESEIHKLQF